MIRTKKDMNKLMNLNKNYKIFYFKITNLDKLMKDF